jgi:hypothetical protein
VIPTIAQAYSFNLTVVPTAGGAVDYVSLWPSNYEKPYVSTVDDPQGAIVSNAAIVPAGNPTGGINVFNFGPAVTDVIIDMNGYFAAPTDLVGNTALGSGTLASNSYGYDNTAIGSNALLTNSTGSLNAATGYVALEDNTSGSNNTANGAYAMQLNTSGEQNTAVGYSAMNGNTYGSQNTALGYLALFSNNGSYNTASGMNALRGNTTGSNNTAVGGLALESNTTGSFNIGIGYYAGASVGSGSNNIEIGSSGTNGDGTAANSGVIRIGTVGQQTSAYIAGISGVTASGGAEVFVNSNGQLGTVTSSRRFKEQITDMGDTSSKLLELHPVNFFYKPQYDDGSHLLQYGLIAEDVAKVYPEMVAYDKDGQLLTVKYQMLAPMLLNEVQKQNAQLQSQVRLQQEENRKLEDRLAAVEALLSGRTSTAAPADGSH